MLTRIMFCGIPPSLEASMASVENLRETFFPLLPQVGLGIKFAALAKRGLAKAVVFLDGFYREFVGL